MSLSDEDKALFRSQMMSVRPLNQSTLRAPKPATTIKLTRRPQEPQPSDQTDYYLSNYYTETVNPQSILSYHSNSIPKHRLRELKNGLIPWEARLDLHGFKPDAARDALCHFIDTRSRNANRCLLIIHGKGGRYGELPAETSTRINHGASINRP